MAESPAQLIKEKLDIVEFIRGYLSLQPAGRNWKTRCPFHKEKTPSFMVSPDRQGWHCFGCNSGGDAFTFLMRYENIEFGEALRLLAEKTGVELRRVSPAEYRFAGLLYDLNEAAKKFFIETFARSDETHAYLRDRGLTKETIEEFELGLAPAESEALTMHLMKLGASPDDLVRAGLTVTSEQGRRFDRFRGRIMFPIHNHVGKVVGFTGRILPRFDDGTMGKYINSPETPIFAKSKLLYGFWKSKNAIRDAGSAFVVEGQMDFLMSWQAGVRHTVATSGTALTLDHLRALRRFTEEIVLSFDSDSAGLAAAERAIDLAEASDFAVKVAISSYEDPAEAVRMNPERFRASIAEARPAMEFYFERYLCQGPRVLGHGTRSERAYVRNLRVILGKIKTLASPVMQAHWLGELSRRTGIEERILTEEAERVAVAAQEEGEIDREGMGIRGEIEVRSTRWELISERLLSAACALNDFEAIKEEVEYLSPTYRAVYELLKKGARLAEDPSVDERLHLVILRSEGLPAEEIHELKSHLRHEYTRERRRELAAAVKAAEQRGDEKAVEAMLRELSDLSQP